MTYREKLLDPRWQKKRLEILNRDLFTCQRCGDEENTLHVHHRYYDKGCEPWDYANSALVTLCKDCHESETDNWKEYAPLLIDTFKRNEFWADDLREIADGFNNVPLQIGSEVFCVILNFTLKHAPAQKAMIDFFFNYKEEMRKKRENK